MRLRNVPSAREAMVESEYTVNEPKEYKGRWNELFGNDNPIRIEENLGFVKIMTNILRLWTSFTLR